MDLATVDVPRAKAREEFLAYKRAVRERLTEEDKALMQGYREIARGHPVISLHEIMERGGFEFHRRPEAMWLPKLAVARADQHEVRVECGPTWTTFAWGTRNPGWDARMRRSLWQTSVRINGQNWIDSSPARGTFQSIRMTARAKVPTVPIALRPARLERYHVLWEADWQLPAPRDPALLKPIGRGLYVVVALWELTELERAVLSGRIG